MRQPGLMDAMLSLDSGFLKRVTGSAVVLGWMITWLAALWLWDG